LCFVPGENWRIEPRKLLDIFPGEDFVRTWSDRGERELAVRIRDHKFVEIVSVTLIWNEYNLGI